MSSYFLYSGKVFRCFSGSYCLHVHFYLEDDAICSSETSENFHTA